MGDGASENGDERDVPDAGGMRWNEARFPGRVPIDSYGGGGFRFAQMSHRGSIFCVPGGIHAWHVGRADDIDAEALRLAVEDTVELLLVGTGVDLIPLPASVTDELRAAGVRVEPMSTGAAARTYNVLVSEGRSVGAALMAIA